MIKRYSKFTRINDNKILFPNRNATDFEIGQKIKLLPENRVYKITKIHCFQPSLFNYDIGRGVYLELEVLNG